MVMIDSSEGSYQLAGLEPLRSMLPLCDVCHGTGRALILDCESCRGTGRVLDSLQAGDVVVPGNGPDGATTFTAVELKSVNDFLSSMEDKRLQGHQIPKMLGVLPDGAEPNFRFNEIWILRYGAVRPHPVSGALQVRIEIKDKKTGATRKVWMSHKVNGREVPYSYLIGFELSPPLLNAGVRFASVYDIQEAAYWIGALARSRMKAYEDHDSLNAIYSPGPPSMPTLDLGLTTKQQQIMRTAASLPGMKGYARPRAMACHFESVREMINADVDTLSEVPVQDRKGKCKRMGKVVAEAFVRAVT